MVSGESVELFYSYSHRDEELRDELEKHLIILRRQGVITTWHDRRIGAGNEWKDAIDQHLESAQVILLLISADFLASDYCYDIEMERALERHDAGEALVIPVILRSVYLRGAPFGKLQAVPTDAKPVTSWADRDEAFTNVASGIKDALDQLKRDNPLSMSGGASAPRGTLPPVWNVPHRRNPNFSGREQLLDDLREALTSGQPAALTQAISGLGGVGKTQLATEYVYRHLGDYAAIMWLSAEDATGLGAAYAGLASGKLLDLPQQDANDQSEIIQAVRHWLGQHTGWLLVFDNAPDAPALREYLPQGETGHVIVTSRDPDWSGTASALGVRVFERPESVEFLLNRTVETDEASAGELADLLGDFPLALEHAAAYAEQPGNDLAGYLSLFKERQVVMMARGANTQGYEFTVATTWEIALEQLPTAAADLLALCSFFAPDDITPGMVRDGREHLPEPLASVVVDDLLLSDALSGLRRYSLIDVTDSSWSVHRLVQSVVRGRLGEPGKQSWAAAAAELVSEAYPSGALTDPAVWTVCALLYPHALAAVDRAEQFQIAHEATGRLLNQIGLYAQIRANFQAARGFLERALSITEGAYGPAHPTVATVLNNLGGVLQDLGDLSGAHGNFERALAITVVAYGPEHPDVAIRLNNLGRVLQDLGDLPGAQGNFERALGIFEQVYGSDHPSTVVVRNNLAAFLFEASD